MATIEGTTTRSAWLTGVRRAMPLVLGYTPIAFAMGVLAQKAGLSTFNTLAMSLLVYAGSAQLIAVGLFGAGAPSLTIVITTFIVNLRHLLLSAAISPKLKGWRRGEIAAFAYELTDETFAVHAADPAPQLDKGVAFGLNLTAQIVWVLGTWLGIAAGQVIQDVRPLALDYALPAMFIALLLMQIKDRIQVGVAVLTGLLSVVLLLAGLDQWSVIAATVIGATVGLGVETWIKRRSS
ncbi:MAG TPA: AzlC family ABC transporter permease [Aggregatilineales bacterium]|nr:AzlC family ABC transporter permease [Chloroflexota bacterium]HOA22747.1 AzlC family ABC transporter permease [Aggregatilineales bacterium]HPV07181.1 AzlC family ABC transporter permease [Aggregatilineales bacterium]HQA66800.1 AzlC family ABC transporter permease [Aggregatilineales bacterium]HQE17245.1 AzlC family ABC transporter permease [Aggregatilineales bacterium]